MLSIFIYRNLIISHQKRVISAPKGRAEARPPPSDPALTYDRNAMTPGPTLRYALPLRVKRHSPHDLPDIANAVKAFADTQNSNRARVAKALGTSSATLAALLKGRNPRIEMLLALSEALEFNLLDLYMRLLPERLRATTETRQMAEQMEGLQQEMDALRHELDSVKRERDLLLSLMQRDGK